MDRGVTQTQKKLLAQLVQSVQSVLAVLLGVPLALVVLLGGQLALLALLLPPLLPLLLLSHRRLFCRPTMPTGAAFAEAVNSERVGPGGRACTVEQCA